MRLSPNPDKSQKILSETIDKKCTIEEGVKLPQAFNDSFSVRILVASRHNCLLLVSPASNCYQIMFGGGNIICYMMVPRVSELRLRNFHQNFSWMFSSSEQNHYH